MSLILEKKLSETELQALGLEFFESALNNTLIESRYDEIIEMIAAHAPISDVLYAMIMDGKPAWREKHLKRFQVRS